MMFFPAPTVLLYGRRMNVFGQRKSLATGAGGWRLETSSGKGGPAVMAGRPESGVAADSPPPAGAGTAMTVNWLHRQGAGF
jgi:hypothetical protein